LLLKAYRGPFDTLEEITTGLSDGVVVNSRYTLSMFESTFPLLSAGGMSPQVLYPCVALASKSNPFPSTSATPILLSINRFERKKDIGTAIRAFAQAMKSVGIVRTSAKQQLDIQQSSSSKEWLLIIAGGFDPRLAENVEYFSELTELAVEVGLAKSGAWKVPGKEYINRILPGWEESTSSSDPSVGGSRKTFPILAGDRVLFIRSFTDPQKAVLLKAAHAIAYTPPCEHFGIVPLECMASGRPVVCDASGGPLESVLDEVTGFLCRGGLASWVNAFEKLSRMPTNRLMDMGARGREHVEKNFSREAFSATLAGYCSSLLLDKRGGGAWKASVWLKPILWFQFPFYFVAIYLGWLLIYYFLNSHIMRAS